jgi:hypothetical protein
MAKVKKEWHAPNSPKGMGDYHGTAIKNPIGRMREDQIGFSAPAPKSVKTPPKSLA